MYEIFLIFVSIGGCVVVSTVMCGLYELLFSGIGE